jgi:hypothetical protein
LDLITRAKATDSPAWTRQPRRWTMEKAVVVLGARNLIESPKTAAFTADQPREALADMSEVAKAVGFLVEQGPRGMTHELVVTPAGDRWVP